MRNLKQGQNKLKKKIKIEQMVGLKPLLKKRCTLKSKWPILMVHLTRMRTVLKYLNSLLSRINKAQKRRRVELEIKSKVCTKLWEIKNW